MPNTKPRTQLIATPLLHCRVGHAALCPTYEPIQVSGRRLGGAAEAKEQRDVPNNEARHSIGSHPASTLPCWARCALPNLRADTGEWS